MSVHRHMHGAYTAWYKKVFPCLKIPASFLPRKMANAKTDFSYLKISLRHITIAKHHQFSGREGRKETHDCLNMCRARTRFENLRPGLVKFVPAVTIRLLIH